MVPPDFFINQALSLRTRSTITRDTRHGYGYEYEHVKIEKYKVWATATYICTHKKEVASIRQ